jgi:hypothetical protein
VPAFFRVNCPKCGPFDIVPISVVPVQHKDDGVAARIFLEVADLAWRDTRAWSPVYTVDTIYDIMALPERNPFA